MAMLFLAMPLPGLLISMIDYLMIFGLVKRNKPKACAPNIYFIA